MEAFFVSGKRGSNPRPSAWEADALPTELLPLVCKYKNTIFKQYLNLFYLVIIVISSGLRIILAFGFRFQFLWFLL